MTTSIDPYIPARELFEKLNPISLRGLDGVPELVEEEVGCGWGKTPYWVLRQGNISITRPMAAWMGRSYSDELAINLRDDNLQAIDEMVEEWNNPKLDHIPTAILQKEISTRAETDS